MYERVCAVILRDDAIVMVHQQHDGKTYWTLPGGGINAGETPHAAVRREVREEIRLSGTVHALLYDRQFRVSGARHSFAVRERCYLMSVTEHAEPAVGHDPELADDEQWITDVAWVPLAQLRDHVQVKQVLAALDTVDG